MDAHELAIAALNEVANPSSHRRTGKVASQSPTATGIDIETDNAIVQNPAGALEPSQQTTGIDAMNSTMGGLQDDALQSTSSNNSQSTTDGHDTVSTPPTSNSDGFSSQSTNQDGQLSQLSQLSQLAAAQQPISNTFAARDPISINPTAGQKRTADGHVKDPSPTSPARPRVRGHSRNTSSVSNISTSSSRIGEVNRDLPSASIYTDAKQLSSELRTRLSYAMVKVNNGWQSNSIAEVESLASQAGSPTSSTSTLIGRRNPVTSPRTTIANIQGQTSKTEISVAQASSGDFDLYSRTEPQLRTYESFWRDHSTSIPTQRSSRVSPPTTKASLAPPADIRPQPTSRRSHTPKFSKPPTISGQGSSSSIPRTPNRGDLQADSKSLQTPSQKTIQEQDAIETLLFMSSPGNSGNMGHQFPPRASQASPQQSPLRAEFSVQERARGAHGRRVGFEKIVQTNSAGSSEVGDRAYVQRNKTSSGPGKKRRDAIDQMLDEMGDSSSDEELVLNYSSPRRVAAGRV